MLSTEITNTSFIASKSVGTVSAILMLPDNAKALLVLAHGAGAGMRQKFLEAISHKLAEHGIGTFRYQFPYMEQGGKRPDPKPVIYATVRSAVETAAKLAPGLPLFAGGKSFGGRMTSSAAAEEPLPHVRGIVFLGFPLHPPGKPSIERAEHLSRVTVPMLFLQGTRDDFAEMSLLKPVVDKLGKFATLHVIDGADHSFHVLKSSGKTDGDVLSDLARMTHQWMSSK
ncbi:MAG: dienelactone hydrolase family protein [Ignavibacteriales bacterium]|nr:dienelactone hydrolase family protein [Ignavibacteriales bacterium]